MSTSGFRRVQAFIVPAYMDRLTKDGYDDNQVELLSGKYRASISYMGHYSFTCMLCDPWPGYCPDYDKGWDTCSCEYLCDFADYSYTPRKLFDLAGILKHVWVEHTGHERPESWFTEAW